jgi:hypothetical protein
MIDSVPPELRLIKDLRNVPQMIKCPGVYFLCKGGKLLYIGQSVQIQPRIYGHMRSKDFDSAYFIPVEKTYLSKFEAAFIHYFKPYGNAKYVDGSMVSAAVSPMIREWIIDQCFIK